jgi:rhamnosyltransferase
MPAFPAVPAPPRVVVLLATRNGVRWLPEQLDSILEQRAVAVRVVALDDESTDGTEAWLAEQAARDSRITLLPSRGASGSAAANFYRLIESADVYDDELVAFADQDDIWMRDKLTRHVQLLAAGRDGVSSDVTAFDESGRRTVIRKSFPQVRFDYLLESPGPGSTFLLSPRLFGAVRAALGREDGGARLVDFHDCLVYAIARAKGWSWHIDDVPSVDYRQHEINTLGANMGVKPALARLRLIGRRWHRAQALALVTVAIEQCEVSERAELETVRSLILSTNVRARWTLARLAGQLRRRPRDKRIIAALIVLGIW